MSRSAPGGGRPRRPDATRSDPARSGAARSGAARSGAARSDPARSGAARSGAARSDPARSGAARSGAARSAAALGGEQLEGRQAVRELLRARRRPVRDVWISDGLEASPLIDEIVELATTARVPIRRVPRGRLDGEARTEAPQGVLAHAQPLPELELEALLVGTARPFLIVLDGVTDPQNVGGLIRTADVAGATGVVLPRHRSAHITPAAAKAAAGAVEHVPLAVVPGIPAALATLREHGVWTVGLDADATSSIWDLELATEAIALVLGAEGAGLSRLAQARCDLLVSIPRRGALDSMNVAAAGAVAAFEVARRR